MSRQICGTIFGSSREACSECFTGRNNVSEWNMNIMKLWDDKNRTRDRIKSIPDEEKGTDESVAS